MNEQPPELPRPTSVARVVDAVICSRRAVRAFRPEAISRGTVAEILAVAATAPSNSNTQPWTVHVLAGDPKRALSDALVDAHNRQIMPPFAHFPDEQPANNVTKTSASVTFALSALIGTTHPRGRGRWAEISCSSTPPWV
jgi:nitroreductase